MATVEQVDALHDNWSPTQAKVDLAVKVAIEVAKPSRVFVFGSWSRSEAVEESDLDLAVFLPDDRMSEIDELREKLGVGFRGVRMSIDLILASEGHVAEFVNSINSVYFKIVRRGKLVYDSQNR